MVGCSQILGLAPIWKFNELLVNIMTKDSVKVYFD